MKERVPNRHWRTSIDRKDGVSGGLITRWVMETSRPANNTCNRPSAQSRSAGPAVRDCDVFYYVITRSPFTGRESILLCFFVRRRATTATSSHWRGHFLLSLRLTSVVAISIFSSSVNSATHQVYQIVWSLVTMKHSKKAYIKCFLRSMLPLPINVNWLFFSSHCVRMTLVVSWWMNYLSPSSFNHSKEHWQRILQGNFALSDGVL